MIRKLFSTCLLVICIGATFMMGYLLWKEWEKNESIKEMEAGLLPYFHTSEKSDTNQPSQPKPSFEQITGAEPSFDWERLQADGENVIGWIQFDEGSRVNYPIVQGEDNNRYLSRDWKGEKQFAGSIFLNAGNDPNFTDPNSIIYGHRMKNRSMFGSFKYYSEQEYLEEHPYFSIYTPDGRKRTYEIFVCANIMDGSDSYTAHFQTVKERNQYYKTLYEQAITSRKVDLDEFDTTVLLSTCAARGYYNRIVLCGKLISIEQNKYPEPWSIES